MRTPNLIVSLLGGKGLFSPYHPAAEEGHDYAVTHITKHNGKEEGEGDDGVWRCREKRRGGGTRIKFTL